MDFRTLYEKRIDNRNKSYLRFLKYHQSMIYLNWNDSRLLYRISTDYMRRPIPLASINKTFNKNLLDLFDLQLIKINIIRNRSIELRPTKLGQELIQDVEHKPINKVRQLFKHKDKMHKIIRCIINICMIMSIILVAYLMVSIKHINQSINLIGFVTCGLGFVMLLIGLMGIYLLRTNSKYSSNITIKQLKNCYKKHQNKEDYQQSLNVIKHKYIEDKTKEHNPDINNDISKQSFE